MAQGKRGARCGAVLRHLLRCVEIGIPILLVDDAGPPPHKRRDLRGLLRLNLLRSSHRLIAQDTAVLTRFRSLSTLLALLLLVDKLSPPRHLLILYHLERLLGLSFG